MTEYGPDLEAELERIHARGPVDADGGRRIPVHYIMEGLDSPRCEVPFDLLMDALNEAGRLPSSHVYRLRFSPLMKESHVAFRHGTAFEWLNENLVDALSDNVLVIEYGEGANDADFDLDLYRMFMHTIEMLNNSLDSVQVVFLLPFGSDFLQERIRRAFMAPPCYNRPIEGDGSLASVRCFREVGRIGSSFGRRDEFVVGIVA